jgi:hypothetical protein
VISSRSGQSGWWAVSEAAHQPGVEAADVVGLGRGLGTQLAQLPVEGFELGKVISVEGEPQSRHTEDQDPAKSRQQGSLKPGNPYLGAPPSLRPVLTAVDGHGFLLTSTAVCIHGVHPGADGCLSYRKIWVQSMKWRPGLVRDDR